MVNDLPLLLLKVTAVFGMGAAPWFEIWTAVPLGVMMGLSPSVAMAAAVTGNLASVAGMVALMPRIRAWIVKKFLAEGGKGGAKASPRQKRFHSLWNQYGIPGVMLGAPLLVGTHLATALCLILGAPVRRAMVWITISIVTWGAVVAVACYLGLEGLKYLSPLL
jgi:uncharacterized membrane protein